MGSPSWLSRHIHFAFAVTCLHVAGVGAHAQLQTTCVYAGVNRAIPITIDSPVHVGDRQSLELVEPQTWRTIEQTNIVPGEADLAVLFPRLWVDASSQIRYVQLVEGGSPRGAPLIIEPLISQPTYIDSWTARLRSVLTAPDPGAEFASLLKLGPETRATLSDQPYPLPPTRVLLSGVRVYVDQTITLETELGDITLALRPDSAPRTAYHFLQLAHGGFYNDTAFHRVASVAPGQPPAFIQAGDPTGTGLGGPGFTVEFEPGTLQHDFGVVSLARAGGAPNSGGSQFFICLSREAGETFDGRYASFAQVVSGADTVMKIATSPVGPREPSNLTSIKDRPLQPPKIIRVTTQSAPAIGSRPAPALRPESTVIER